MFYKIKNKIVFYFKLVLVFLRYPKYIFIWKKSPLDSEMPWINFATKSYLDKKLNEKMIIFEYGSGGSTFYFSKRVEKVISVEHNEDWYKIVKDKLDNNNIKNVEIHLCPPKNLLTNESVLCLSSDQNYKNKNFQEYVEKINNYPDNYFDLIVIDGRARVSCIKNSISKVKSGGYIFLDNSERKEYAVGIDF